MKDKYTGMAVGAAFHCASRIVGGLAASRIYYDPDSNKIDRVAIGQDLVDFAHMCYEESENMIANIQHKQQQQTNDHIAATRTAINKHPELVHVLSKMTSIRAKDLALKTWIASNGDEEAFITSLKKKLGVKDEG